MILDDGCAWNGCVYRSLSQVAKAITGTNWNGHRFFGLKAVRTGASNRKRNVTPRPDSLLDIGVSPTLAGFAPAMPDRSPPLATKESNSASPLGAKVVNRLDRWVVMQAPTGQRFCVVRVQRPGFPKNANSWN